MSIYYRPIIQMDNSKPKLFYNVGKKKQWFDRVEIMQRGEIPKIVPAQSIPVKILKRIQNARDLHDFGSIKRTMIMGILNVTPDSFSDGGKNFALVNAIKAAEMMISEGADILDIGGESTRPGAKVISEHEELTRIIPVLKHIKRNYPSFPVSVDTRKSGVMARVIELGIDFINDVSAMSFDSKSKQILAAKDTKICLMHGGLDPEKMQDNISYTDVLLDVYDYLRDSIDAAIATGILPENIIIDPGIGFGKTTEQNLLLIRKASLFHSLGYPILYGVSRKRFIGVIGQVSRAVDRFPGSIATTIELVRQGIQVIRVHDVRETKQALNLWESIINTDEITDGRYG